MTSRCPVCCECIPQFHRLEKVPLIKATQPYERINIDFKGPLPTNNGNKYFLMGVDEHSRFHLFSHVLMCLRTQSLSALHGCSHLLECQRMSIQTTELHLWAESYANSCLRKGWLQVELPVTTQRETVKQRDAMARYGKQLLWVWNPRTYHSRTGKMSPWCATLCPFSFVHCHQWNSIWAIVWFLMPIACWRLHSHLASYTWASVH